MKDLNFAYMCLFFILKQKHVPKLLNFIFTILETSTKECFYHIIINGIFFFVIKPVKLGFRCQNLKIK